MSHFRGLELLAGKIEKEHEAVKEERDFLLKWVELKFRDGCRITNDEYKDCLNQLSRMRGPSLPNYLLCCGGSQHENT